MTNKKQETIDAILQIDSTVDQLVRNSWPEGWLQINLPVGSTRVLLAIEGRDARTPGRVADALGVSRTTVTGLLDRLEGEGLITRTIDPSDRRCFMLQLTSKGHDLVTQIVGHRGTQLLPALSRMSIEELAALQMGLTALYTQLGAIEPAPAAAS